MPCVDYARETRSTRRDLTRTVLDLVNGIPISVFPLNRAMRKGSDAYEGLPRYYLTLFYPTLHITPAARALITFSFIQARVLHLDDPRCVELRAGRAWHAPSVSALSSLPLPTGTINLCMYSLHFEPAPCQLTKRIMHPWVGGPLQHPSMQ